MQKSFRGLGLILAASLIWGCGSTSTTDTTTAATTSASPSASPVASASPASLFQTSSDGSNATTSVSNTSSGTTLAETATAEVVSPLSSRSLVMFLMTSGGPPGGPPGGGPPPGSSPGAVPAGSPPPAPPAPTNPLQIAEMLVREAVRSVPGASGTVNGQQGGTAVYTVDTSSVSIQYNAFVERLGSLQGFLGLQWTGDLPLPGRRPSPGAAGAAPPMGGPPGSMGGPPQGPPPDGSPPALGASPPPQPSPRNINGEVLLTLSGLQITGTNSTNTLDGTVKLTINADGTTMHQTQEATLKSSDLALNGFTRTSTMTRTDDGGDQSSSVSGTLTSGTTSLQITTVTPVHGTFSRANGPQLVEGDVTLTGTESIRLKVVSANVVEVTRNGATEQITLPSPGPRPSP